MEEASHSSSKRLVKNQEQIDRLFNLHDSLLVVILSFLPTDVLARISILSRRLHNIFKAIHLIEDCTRHSPNMDDCALLRHDTNYPLSHLTLYPHHEMTDDDLASLLLKAQSLGLYENHFESTLPVIFSFDDLLSLSFDGYFESGLFPPSCISLTRLKTLSICLFKPDCNIFNEIVGRFCCVEELFLKLKGKDVFKLMSRTIKKLHLTLQRCAGSAFPWLCRLFIPNLEFLDLKISTDGSVNTAWMPHISGEMPKLREACISIDWVRPNNVPVIHELLNNIRNVENLKLDLAEHSYEMYAFHMMLNPHIKPPMFPNLKSLELSLCFHAHNMEDLIELLQNCPVLESLKLVRKGPNISLKSEKKLGFRSRLPRIADGNNHYLYFYDLHIEEKREELFKLLTKKIT